MNMKHFVVEQIPVPLPSTLSVNVPWLGSTAEDWLAVRVLELCYTNEELTPFAADLGRNHPPFRWLPDRRVLLQAEIDAAVLHLYGLDRAQVEWLLDSFTVLRKYEERDHGEFRTKRVVLEIYDEIAAAKQTDRAFQTRLNPIPADPSCCHPESAVTVPRAAAAPDFGDAPVGAWARTMPASQGDTGAMLAALLKSMDGALSARQVRLAAVLALEPRLLVPHLDTDEAASWRRLVGGEATPLPSGVTQFVARTNQAWGAAVINLRGNGQLVEDVSAGTWAPGAGLDAIVTTGWPDGRAQMVLGILSRVSIDEVVATLPDDLRGWIDAAAA